MGAFACLEIMKNASSGGAVTDVSYLIVLSHSVKIICGEPLARRIIFDVNFFKI